ncbi:prephenate dehydratase [Halobacteriovorax sp. HLS]|uniref:prephenate dehydratase n=1 Tax=Halobacteriovorax sp. HLS TaxID=2234000 RepID=UPI000FDA2958|nr:prephenate dehydratase [Halobacteriovorax sp. HLS]
MKIAFQGKKGAYSEMAILSYFQKDVIATGYDLSEEVCEALENDEVAIGVLPVENSIVGNVAVNVDLLLNHHFFIIGEIYLPIKHCLLARKGTKIEDIKTVKSHPIALAQCHDFLVRNRIKGIPEFDTAGSSELLSKDDSLKEEGTISSSLSAQYYGLEILSDNIQKVETNFTRFVVFVKEKNIPETLRQEKTSLAFSTNHNPGALLKCLEEFANHGLNLTKIESRPIPENPFMYTFFVDFLGSIHDQNVQDCLIKLKENTKSIKIFGSYPQGKF